MSPIRREADFQRTEIEEWDSWVEEQIQEAQARGEFDDLPDVGKPITIWRTEVNPDYDLAFSRMKNADVRPAWMELDRDVTRLSRELDEFLERSTVWLLEQRDELMRSMAQKRTPAPGTGLPIRPWWRFWQRWIDLLRLRSDEGASPRETRSIADLIRLREHIRAQYMEHAALLDTKIESYHNALPRGLSYLQRLRMLPDKAASRFDAYVPAALLLVEPCDPDDQAAKQS